MAEQGKPGLLSAGFGIATIADTAYTMTSTDEQVLTTVALTAARIVTLPSAASVPIGSSARLIADLAGGATSSNTISVARAGSDTINGSASSQVINAAYGFKRLISNGVNGWATI